VAALGAAARGDEAQAAVESVARRLQVHLHDGSDLEQWVIQAAERDARALYLPLNSTPFVRFAGQITPLSTQRVPLALFERTAAAMHAEQNGWRRDAVDGSWTNTVADVGVIVCRAYADARGGGLVVHLPQSDALTLEPAIPHHLRTACERGDGLIVVSAPFPDDVATMVEAVVARSTRLHRGYVVAFGQPSGLEHVIDGAVVSERSLPESRHGVAAEIVRAVRERPDVITVVVDSASVPGAEAIVRAAVGRLVIVGVVARTAARAVGALLSDFIDPGARDALADVFTAACSWRRVRRPGKSIVLSDVLTANASTSSLIREGNVAGLERMMRDGRNGTRSVDAALARAVVRKKISLREAVACAVERGPVVRMVRTATRRVRT
jgi:Tfp pilus assembly pilus retraction ATPase PilT